MRYENAHRLFRRAVDDRELCSWCFSQKRILQPEYDEMEAHQLRWGATKQTFYAKGHNMRSDGGVDVNFSSSEAHPSTMRDTPPSTTIDGKYKRGTPRNICQCGAVDHGMDNRSLSHLHTCLDNLIEWFYGMDLSMYPDDFNEEAGHDIITLLRQYDNMVGKDEVVLTEGIRCGLNESDS